MRALRKKIERSYRRRGGIGTILYAIARMSELIKRLITAPRRKEGKGTSVDEAFDARFGVDTDEIVPLTDLDIKSKNWIYGVRYEPIEVPLFNQVLSRLDIPYERFTFIDFGAGKGRAVLLASAFPFKRIIGVEFSEALVRIAEDNLARFPDGDRFCKHIDFICMDAAEYPLPEEEPLVLYFYNPFEQAVMRRVVENVVASYTACPRRIIVLYFTPVWADLWNRVEFLTRVETTPGFCLYDTHPDEALDHSGGSTVYNALHIIGSTLSCSSVV